MIALGWFGAFIQPDVVPPKPLWQMKVINLVDGEARLAGRHGAGLSETKLKPKLKPKQLKRAKAKRHTARLRTSESGRSISESLTV